MIVSSFILSNIVEIPRNKGPYFCKGMLNLMKFDNDIPKVHLSAKLGFISIYIMLVLNKLTIVIKLICLVMIR